MKAATLLQIIRISDAYLLPLIDCTKLHMNAYACERKNTLTAIKRLEKEKKNCRKPFGSDAIEFDWNILPKANLEIFGFKAEFSSLNFPPLNTMQKQCRRGAQNNAEQFFFIDPEQFAIEK